jgi:SAM-dependent methyltransferase
MSVTRNDLYTSGAYLTRHPGWHAEESPWKAAWVLRLLARNRIAPRTICDVGCGVGEVLRLVQAGLEDCTGWGYEVSPQALALARSRASARLHFALADIRDDDTAHFDVMLLMDVIEHLEDHLGFLRAVHPRSDYKVLHIPLDISVRTVAAGELIAFRAAYGHLHSFTKETALQMLADAGYEVLDWLYTREFESLRSVWQTHRGGLRLARKLAGAVKRRLLALPERACFAIHADATVRVLGRRRLLVLAR